MGPSRLCLHEIPPKNELAFRQRTVIHLGIAGGVNVREKHKSRFGKMSPPFPSPIHEVLSPLAVPFHRARKGINQPPSTSLPKTSLHITIIPPASFAPHKKKKKKPSILVTRTSPHLHVRPRADLTPTPSPPYRFPDPPNTHDDSMQRRGR